MANDVARAERPPLLKPGQTYASATDQIASVVLSRRTPRAWFIGFIIAFIFALAFIYGFAYLLAVGVGIFGIVAVLLGWSWRERTLPTAQVRVTGLYWHFVDIVWVFLYPILYLIK